MAATVAAMLMPTDGEGDMTSDSYSTDDARWGAMTRRDKAADGRFFYGVRTTGVYCRPSCAARQPRRENVSFFADAESAAQGGFQTCRRCRPDAPPGTQQAEAVARACRLIETAVEAPSLEELAAAAGLSSYHFHRVFKAATGLTPRAYAAAQRSQRVRDELPRSGTVTEAIYGAGFGSNGRFYAHANELLGMAPQVFRGGGRGETIRFAVGQCTLGAILVAATGKGLCAILIGEDPEALVRDLQDRFPKAELVGGDAAFEQRVAQVVGFVEAPRLGLALPLDVRGTAFQQRVWQALLKIPPGSTASYAEIAEQIGQPRAVRAVAQACASNALAVAIPCHRVVRRDGNLSGYRWGVERKRALLEREASPEGA